MIHMYRRCLSLLSVIFAIILLFVYGMHISSIILFEMSNSSDTHNLIGCLDLEGSGTGHGKTWSETLWRPEILPKISTNVNLADDSGCHSSDNQHRHNGANVTCRAADEIAYHWGGIRYDIVNMSSDESKQATELHRHGDYLRRPTEDETRMSSKFRPDACMIAWHQRRKSLIDEKMLS